MQHVVHVVFALKDQSLEALMHGDWCNVNVMMSRQPCLCFVFDTSLPVKCCGAVHVHCFGSDADSCYVPPYHNAQTYAWTNKQTNNNMDTDTFPTPHSCPFSSSVSSAQSTWDFTFHLVPYTLQKIFCFVCFAVKFRMQYLHILKARLISKTA